MMQLTPEQWSRVRSLEVDGKIEPGWVVADARHPSSPLHTLPCWKGWDAEALAEQALLEAARRILRIRVLVTTETVAAVAVPVYVRDSTKLGDVPGYVSVAKLQASPTAARRSMELEVSRAESALRRCLRLSEVLNQREVVVAAIDRLQAIRDALQYFDEPTDGGGVSEAVHQPQA